MGILGISYIRYERTGIHCHMALYVAAAKICYACSKLSAYTGVCVFTLGIHYNTLYVCLILSMYFRHALKSVGCKFRYVKAGEHSMCCVYVRYTFKFTFFSF